MQNDLKDDTFCEKTKHNENWETNLKQLGDSDRLRFAL